MVSEKSLKNGSPTTKKGVAIEIAYSKIKRLLYINQLVPGQKLIYKDLSGKLDVGVTPVVQALNRLEASGLVDYEPNKGYCVGEITELEARNLYQAREALELFALPLVIENLDSKKLDEITRAFKKYRLAITNGNRRELVLLDSQFHLNITEYARNEVIQKLLKGVFEQLYLKYRAEYLGDDRIKTVIREHRALLGALRKGDVEETLKIARKHIRNGMEHVVVSLHENKKLLMGQI